MIKIIYILAAISLLSCNKNKFTYEAEIHNKELIRIIEQFIDTSSNAHIYYDSNFIEIWVSQNRDLSHDIRIEYIPPFSFHKIISTNYIICQKIEGKRILINPNVWYDATYPDWRDRIKLIREEHPEFSEEKFNGLRFFKNYKKHINDTITDSLYIETSLSCKFDAKMKLIDSSLSIIHFETLISKYYPFLNVNK